MLAAKHVSFGGLSNLILINFIPLAFTWLKGGPYEIKQF